MWKESYRVGIEFIDTQHKELFDTTDKLLRIIESQDDATRKQECMFAINFLKNYAARHFAEEEEYQFSINYSDIEAHKTLHRIFVATVLKLEKKLIDADFSIPTMKEVAGFLTAWLTYHVAGVDQKLKRKERLSEEKAALITSYIDCFAESTGEVLETMAGLSAQSVNYVTYSGSADDIRIMIGLIGEHKGEAVFTYTKEIAFYLIKTMAGMELTEVDELVYSTLCEMANIISGTASTRIFTSGRDIDIKTPKIISGFTGADNRSGVYFDTEFGRIAVSVNVT